jgi:hypothetical protein
MVSVKGFEQAEAIRLGESIGAAAREFSRFIDLEALDGITIAADYPAALRELDRGFEATSQLTPTTENGLGIAMTPTVLRGGIVKAHMVFHGGVAFQLVQQEDVDGQAHAFYTVAHECGHVELTKVFDKAFPGRLLKHRHTDYEESFVAEAARGCWDEYAASRLSGPFGEKQLPLYEETFVTVLQNARERGNAAIRAFRLHADLMRLLAEVGPIYRQVLTFGSYLLGHLAGRSESLSSAKSVEAALDGHWYAPHFLKLSAELEKLWSRYGEWSSFDEFAPIGAIAKNVMREAGVDIQRESDGRIRVNVPFTPETIPS